MPKQQRSTNKGKQYEKPISLFPLSFTEAVSAFLKVKPKPQEKKKRKPTKKKAAK